MLLLSIAFCIPFLMEANWTLWARIVSIAAVSKVFSASLISFIRSSNISSIRIRRFSALTLNKSILSNNNINIVDAIPDNIVDKITDQGSVTPILFKSASIPIPQMAITLPPKIFIIASPFCAAVI